MSYQRKLIILSHLDLSFPIDKGFKNVTDAHNNMIDSLLSQPLGKDFCILLITDFWQKNQDLKSSIKTYTTAKIEEEVEERNFNTVLFSITRQHNRVAPAVECVRSFGNVNMGNYDTLSLILAYVNEKFISAETALLTWDHGYGFGIFHDQPNKESITDPKLLIHIGNVLINAVNEDVVSPLSDNEVLPVADTGKRKRRKKTDTIPFEVSNLNRTDMLTCNELAVAIQRGFHGKKLDLLIFMNCNMMLIDDLYTLGLGVKYVVGAESPISWLGYNYRNLISMLSEKKNRIVDVIASIFKNFPEVVDTETEDDSKWEIISCFNLQAMDDLLHILNNLTLSFIRSIPDMHSSIQEYLSQLPDDSPDFYHDRDVSNLILVKDADGKVTRKEFYDICLYDFVDFLSFIQVKISDKQEDTKMKEINDLIVQFNELIANSRIDLFNGFEKRIPKSNSHNLITTFSGVSFFFPRDLKTLEESAFYDFFYSASGVFRSILSQQSFWNEFILLYCKYDNIIQFQP